MTCKLFNSVFPFFPILHCIKCCYLNWWGLPQRFLLRQVNQAWEVIPCPQLIPSRLHRSTSLTQSMITQVSQYMKPLYQPKPRLLRSKKIISMLIVTWSWDVMARARVAQCPLCCPPQWNLGLRLFTGRKYTTSRQISEAVWPLRSRCTLYLHCWWPQ